MKDHRFLQDCFRQPTRGQVCAWRLGAALVLCAAVAGGPLADVATAQEQRTMTVERRGEGGVADRITLDLVNVEIQQLFQFLSRETNLTIIASSEDIRGKQLTMVNLRNVTVPDAVNRIKSGLMQFGLTTIQTDTTLIVTTVQKAAKMKVPVRVGLDPEQIPDVDEVITQVIPLSNLQAAQLGASLKPMVSDAGVVFGDATSNAVVITDVASNIRRIAQVLQAMDTEPEVALRVKVIQIKSGNAETIARALNELFRDEAQVTQMLRKAAGAPNPDEMRKMMERAQTTGVDMIRGRVQIAANADSNQILVKASEENIAIIETLVSQLDAAPAIQTEFRVYRLRYADATKVVEALQEVVQGATGPRSGRRQQDRFRPWWEQQQRAMGETAQGIVGEVRIAADERLNGIIVATDPRNFTILDALIEQVDQQDQPTEEIEIFFLKFGDATTVVQTLQTLIEGQQEQDNRPWWWWDDRRREETREGLYGLRGQVNLSAETRLNAVVAATSSANIAVLRDLITRLDVNLPDQEWGTRIYPLRYADAENVANIISTVYEGSRQQQRGGGGFFFFLPSFMQRQRTYAQGSLAGNVVATAYPTTNSVIISTATARNFELIEQFLRELDVETPPQQREVTRVFNLEYASATNLATLLGQLWEDTGGGQGGGFFNFARAMSRGFAPEQTDINSLVGKVRLLSDADTNSLIVTTASRYMPDVQAILRELDIVRGQVWLNITILELTLDDTTKLGLEMTLTEKRLFGADAFGKGRAPGTNPITGTFEGDQNLDTEVTGFTLSMATKEYLAFLHTLMRQNKVRTLSRPSLYVRDNQEVLFTSGRDIPYLQSARTSDFLTGQIFDFAFLQDVGINITITPHIARRKVTESGKRTIGLEIAQITASNFLEFTSFNAPLTEESRIQTYIDAQDGQQIVIGGLKKQKTQRIVEKVPVLGDLPLLGVLFRKTEDVVQDSEIVVIIEPHIVNINEEGDRIRLEQLQTERFPVTDGTPAAPSTARPEAAAPDIAPSPAPPTAPSAQGPHEQPAHPSEEAITSPEEPTPPPPAQEEPTEPEPAPTP
jgi:type II secretion system protein D